LILQTSSDFIKTIVQKEEDFFDTHKKYMTMSYGETSQSVYDMLHHCMNHSTYHRGQVIMMLRQLGFENPPHLDFMFWKIQLSKES
jgi:uncharacterized damage-inducible protein DinB